MRKVTKDTRTERHKMNRIQLQSWYNRR